MTRPPMRISATVLGAPNPGALATFYERLLGWERSVDEPEWVMLRAPGGDTGLSFQIEAEHVPPTWPPRPGEQQMMMHLDIGVADLDEGVRWAIDAGARQAEHQPQDDVRVMLDPVGHPFCLFAAPIAWLERR